MAILQMACAEKFQKEVIGSCLFHSKQLYNSNLNELLKLLKWVLVLFVLNFVATSLLKPIQYLHQSVETRSAINRKPAFRTKA